MALRGTLTHRKTRKLAMALKVSQCHALGICEALWHVAGEQAPMGNVGRMEDSDLAMEMFYDGNAEDLVTALLAAGLIDKHETHRLVVHDWHEHSDDATDNRLARAGQRYANGAQPRMRRMDRAERAKLCARYGYSVRTDAHEKPLPVPEPVPEPVPVKEQRPVAAAAAAPPAGPKLTKSEKVEVRHAVFKGLIFDAWREWKIPDTPEPPWDGAEGRQLGMLLRANPLLEVNGFRRLLQHRARSEDVNLALRPADWVRGITKYGKGPLNKFGGPLEASNGTHRSNGFGLVGKAGRAQSALELADRLADADYGGAGQGYEAEAGGDVSEPWGGAGSGEAGFVLEGVRREV